jgi:hypothetical protein
VNWRTFLLSIVLFDFIVLSAYTVAEVGYLGIIVLQLDNWGGVQIITDLVIACSLMLIWMVDDARKRGTRVWPFAVVTLFAGSIGPLAYLLWREWGTRSRVPASVELS